MVENIVEDNKELLVGRKDEVDTLIVEQEEHLQTWAV